MYDPHLKPPFSSSLTEVALHPYRTSLWIFIIQKSNTEKAFSTKWHNDAKFGITKAYNTDLFLKL